ncbi:MAG: methyltransferase domain-containing protein, partial [Bellilinea sp.]
LLALLDSLRNTVKKLSWKPAGTEWGDYYNQTNYTDQAFENKRQVLSGWIEKINPAMVWDLGANNGAFSRIASQAGHFTAAFDIDPAAVEQNYRQVKQAKETHILPLLQDLTNPSANIGWANRERDALAARGPADLLLALALIHHLALSNNTPLPGISAYLRELGSSLIIEFVPKSDSQVQKMLASREDIFPDYTPAGFEAAFSQHWEIVDRSPVADSDRVLYWLRGK